MAEGIEMTKTRQPLFTHREDVLERHVDPLLSLSDIEMMTMLSIAQRQVLAQKLVPVVERPLINGFILRMAQAAYTLVYVVSCLDIELGFCFNHAQAAQRTVKITVGAVEAIGEGVYSRAKIECDEIVFVVSTAQK
jgi:hypothetical protein